MDEVPLTSDGPSNRMVDNNYNKNIWPWKDPLHCGSILRRRWHKTASDHIEEENCAWR
jgi:hypothetical protein